MKKKQRYINVYKERLLRIYGKYNMKNKNKINKWLNTYGGDIDKLHELYVKICNKYDLIALNKYDGQMANIPRNEIEISKEIKPAPIIGIPINIIKEESKKLSKSFLTHENIDKHDANTDRNININNDNTDDDSRSDGTYSTFHATPKEFKDIDQQSNKSDTLNTNNNESNPFFFQPVEPQSKKKQFNISFEDIKQNDNDNWNNLCD
eukprot:948337_1